MHVKWLKPDYYLTKKPWLHDLVRFLSSLLSVLQYFLELQCLLHACTARTTADCWSVCLYDCLSPTIYCSRFCHCQMSWIDSIWPAWRTQRVAFAKHTSFTTEWQKPKGHLDVQSLLFDSSPLICHRPLQHTIRLALVQTAHNALCVHAGNTILYWCP